MLLVEGGYDKPLDAWHSGELKDALLVDVEAQTLTDGLNHRDVFIYVRVKLYTKYQMRYFCTFMHIMSMSWAFTRTIKFTLDAPFRSIRRTAPSATSRSVD